MEIGHKTLRIFVGEWVSGGGQWGHPDPALLPEGQMMATRLVDDLVALSGIEVLLARDPSLPPLRPDVDEVRQQDWLSSIVSCDAAWIIAPESNGILLALTRMVEASGRTLLGCRSDAVAIASSKLETAKILSAAGIPTIPTPDRPGHIPASDTGWIAKPDDGAGAEDMIATRDRVFLEQWIKGREATHIVQPHIHGFAASATALARNGMATVLSVNSQTLDLTQDGCCYRGGVIGGYEEYRVAITPIIQSIAKALPGLWGPVGVDFIMTEQGPIIVEINPRLTTAWAGLHQALGINPAGLVLALKQGLPECRPVRPVSVELS